MNQYQLNNEITEFINKKDSANESYSKADIEYIKQYTGSGGQGKHGATGEGVLYEFYTPGYICEIMWKLAAHHGYDGGTILEPSAGTGALLEHAPDQNQCTAFEINPVNFRILQLTYPEATVHNQYFETTFLTPPRFVSRVPKGGTWLPGAPFSLVIGNPPYGKYANKYSGYFKEPKIKQIEQYFMYYGLQLLKPGGLLVYLTSSNFLRNGMTYENAKMWIGGMADIIDAYRLPPVFDFSQVPVDILVFKKKMQ